MDSVDEYNTVSATSVVFVFNDLLMATRHPV